MSAGRSRLRAGDGAEALTAFRRHPPPAPQGFELRARQSVRQTIRALATSSRSGGACPPWPPIIIAPRGEEGARTRSVGLAARPAHPPPVAQAAPQLCAPARCRSCSSLLAAMVRTIMAPVLWAAPPTHPPGFALRARQPGDEAARWVPPGGRPWPRSAVVPPPPHRLCRFAAARFLRLAARHCHQSAAVDLMQHRGVAIMPLFERLRAVSECGSAEDPLAASSPQGYASSETCP